ncbi:MAG: SMP-30/gluconolactonase/LRE family protein, partial [Candidatus Binataceae bacterium]
SSGALVTTTSAGAVVTYHPVTHEMTEHATDLQELYGVAMAPNGTIVVAEGGAGRVLQIDRAGVRVMARGLARPTGIASAGDGSCYVCEAGAGRVVQVNGGVNTVLEGLRDPQGLLRVSHELFVIDADAHELVGYSLRTKQRETIASNLPVGAPPGVTPKTLMGIAGLLPGPLRPFAGLASASDGTIFLSADGDGSVLALRRT